MTRIAFWRKALLALALVALGVRVAAPPGYMLAADARGELTVALCGGDHALVLDLASGKRTDPAQQPTKPAADGHCLFAAAPTPAPAAAQTSLSARTFAYIAATAPDAPARIGEGLAAPPPPSTGPPARS